MITCPPLRPFRRRHYHHPYQPWVPARTTDVKGGSRQYSVRDVAAHTALKFRQLGQNSVGEVSWSHLKVELLVAEEEVRSRKQEYYGRRWDWTKARITRTRIRTSPELLMSVEERCARASRLLPFRSFNSRPSAKARKKKGMTQTNSSANSERIKRERAEEKGRQEREKSSAKAAAREVEIVTSNSFLNVTAALGQSPGSILSFQELSL
ncbi:hypothetical protein F5141DRAFT_734945 [Pisolithus sp. B1]|nr:hypothetical protein F5141DRAFT_734945 [Pisolithus sp. B1]